MFSAAFLVIPFTAASSSTEASRMASMEPKRLRRARRRLGPMQDRGQAGLAPQLAVVADGEAMGLVADALQEAQALGVARQDQGLRAAGDENLLPPLGQPQDGHLIF